jgi:putative peptidoglycan lipid II flippase
MEALFMRGAFNEQSALAAGAVLAAYGVGLPAVVLIRSAVASFYARQDTVTPLIASFCGIGVNLALKLVLFKPLGAPGLALATAIGAWINIGLLVWLANRRGLMRADTELWRTLAAVTIATVALAVMTIIDGPILNWSQTLPTLRAEARLAVLGGLGATLYFAILYAGLRVLRVPFRRV